MKLISARSMASGDVHVILRGKKLQRRVTGWSNEETAAATAAFTRDLEALFLPGTKRSKLAVCITARSNGDAGREQWRKLGADCAEILNRNKVRSIYVDDQTGNAQAAFDWLEGLALANYQFLRYRNSREGRNTLGTLRVAPSTLEKKELAELQALVEAVCKARDLVNEPLSFLTAVQLGKELQLLGEEAGISVRVLQKKEIESLGMGGVLAVNRGSVDPPTFSILEYRPENARNSRPVVLVGKGVVYDTGGLSLKHTKMGMDFMKCDMAGGAAVAGALYAAAKVKLPVHVISLVPATDNRPGGNAYVPGDVVTMYSGKTVEVLNTDAEGRMLLADALHYAKQYNPELVIDLATLTGAAAAAIGPLGIVAMGTADRETFDQLKASGEAVYERLAEFPFWPEYGEEIKSEIADIKNVGGGFGGAITAGKFLEHFTSYPWIHLDIAGPAYLHLASAYRTRFGTGIGVRLLFDFLKNYAKEQSA